MGSAASRVLLRNAKKMVEEGKSVGDGVQRRPVVAWIADDSENLFTDDLILSCSLSILIGCDVELYVEGDQMVDPEQPTKIFNNFFDILKTNKDTQSYVKFIGKIKIHIGSLLLRLVDVIQSDFVVDNRYGWDSLAAPSTIIATALSVPFGICRVKRFIVRSVYIDYQKTFQQLLGYTNIHGNIFKSDFKFWEIEGKADSSTAEADSSDKEWKKGTSAIIRRLDDGDGRSPPSVTVDVCANHGYGLIARNPFKNGERVGSVIFWMFSDEDFKTMNDFNQKLGTDINFAPNLMILTRR